MSGLIVLLFIWIIINSLTSRTKKEKQEQKRAAKAHAFDTAFPKTQAKPQPRPKAVEGQRRIPFSKEEWKAYLSEMSEELVRERAATAPIAHDEDDRFHEGFISTQGESAEEHAEHRRRIEAEEAQHRAEREALDDLRSANRERLRAAIVMSEVLGKPVSLRPRTGDHR